MAFSKYLVVSILLCLLLHFVQADHQPASHSVQADFQPANVNTDDADMKTARKMDCGPACTARCQLSSRPNLCKRACGTCCARCNCVPQGTSGNQETCPCYYTMTTHGGKRKCP